MSRIAKLRRGAFLRQHERCHYCRCPMWEDTARDFAQRHGLTLKQSAAFRSTAEHLTPASEGGRDVAENIVAACWHCNSRRHWRRGSNSPQAYQALVLRRVATGTWLTTKLLAASNSPVTSNERVSRLRPVVIRANLPSP
jgi:hypothetical protein